MQFLDCFSVECADEDERVFVYTISDEFEHSCLVYGRIEQASENGSAFRVATSEHADQSCVVTVNLTEDHISVSSFDPLGCESAACAHIGSFARDPGFERSTFVRKDELNGTECEYWAPSLHPQNGQWRPFRGQPFRTEIVE